ncbi:MAG: hypothetical protein SGARI_008000 [Bacillariaceae sp.]
MPTVVGTDYNMGDPFAKAFIHNMLTVPHCNDCRARAAQMAYSSISEAEFGDDNQTKEAKKALKLMRNNFLATCPHCHQVEDRPNTFKACSQITLA